MKILKQWFTNKKIVILIVLLIIGGCSMWFVNHNQMFYHDTIAKVTKVEADKPQKQVDTFKNKDQVTQQKLTLHILNGNKNGQDITIKNEYSDSQAADQKYKVNDQIFVKLHHYDGKLGGTIQGFKRDYVLVFLAWIVVCLLMMSMAFKGSMALLSVILNAVLFIFAVKLDLHWQGNHVMAIFGTLAVVFSVLTLLLVLGPSKRMLATLGATILGTSISILISLAVFALTHEKGIYYESMEYVTQVPRPLFLAETLLGSLGAVMDESTDIVATLFELKSIDPNISRGQLFLSGRKVGQSIMGPLVNVLFLIFMTDTFISTLLYIKNGNSWGYTFAMNMSLGTVQSLISGIGIVLAIPVASGLAALLLGRRQSV